MTLGSLFDGIGGFPLAASRYNIKALWASEIEPWPIKVTQHHFPGMVHLGDLTKINGAEIEPVDVITFGSPCQDLSVAGKRAGLEGERSGLFMEAVRIIREMKEATYGVYPRFAVWENVPGAFSSHQGQDFRAVLEEIAEAEIPMPTSGKWAEAGMVRTERVDVAWRTLDAQYWGVPQRRKRIFLVADFAGQCASEILFESSCVSGDTAQGREAREKVATAAGEGVDAAGVCWKRRGGFGWSESNGISPTLESEGGSHQGGPENIPLVMDNKSESAGLYAIAFGGAREQNVSSPLMANEGPNRHQGFSNTQFDAVCTRMREGCDGGGKGPLISEDKSLTLGCCNDQTLTVLADQGGSQMDVLENLSPTLRAQEHGHQPIVATRIDSTPSGISGTVSSKWAKGTGGFAGDECYNLIREGYSVRRLTPLECLRLQGFPDDWLDIEGMSDTAKYKAIGNSVAVPCVEFVMAGIAKKLRGESV